MAKKSILDPSPNELAVRDLSHMNYRDTQKACILKGMDFELVCTKGAPFLAQWYIQNYDNTEDPKRLHEYDEWYEKKLVERGYKKGDAMLHPSFRFGYTEGFEESDVKVAPAPKSVEKPFKEKREKDDSGMYTGTKKALTKQLAEQGLSFEETVTKVLNQFPEANAKSVKIWFKKFGGKG